MELENLKKYPRIDEDDDSDNETIKDLQKAAEEYLTNAGVKIDYEKQLYCLAVKLLVTHWYDNRIITTDKNQSKLPFSLDAIIMQLKFSD